MFVRVVHGLRAELDRREVELQVDDVEIGARPEEAAPLTHVGGEHAAAAQVVVGDLRGRFCVLERAAPRGRDERHRRMVLQSLADPREVVDDVDADVTQVRRRADARQHEELRAVDGSTGEDHLAVDMAGASPPSAVLDAGARPSSTSTRVASACVRTVRFGRPRAGRRNADGGRPAPAAPSG